MNSESTTTATAASSSSYDPLDSDPVFLKGLESILTPLIARGATEDEIQQMKERAKSFYLASKAKASTSESAPPPPVPSSSSETVPSETPSSSSALPNPPEPPSTSASNDPPYPLSFSALASLIASGAPIPGIKDIPDKLAEGSPSESVLAKKGARKPWEKVAVAEADEGKEEAGVGEEEKESVMES